MKKRFLLFPIAAGIFAITAPAEVLTITEFPVPTAASQPYSIALGPDGNLWFTETGTNKIGRVTPTGGFTEFSIPTPGSQPHAITTGPDGNLWFTEAGAGKIGRVNLSSVALRGSQ